MVLQVIHIDIVKAVMAGQWPMRAVLQIILPIFNACLLAAIVAIVILVLAQAAQAQVMQVVVEAPVRIQKAKAAMVVQLPGQLVTLALSAVAAVELVINEVTAEKVVMVAMAP